MIRWIAQRSSGLSNLGNSTHTFSTVSRPEILCRSVSRLSRTPLWRGHNPRVSPRPNFECSNAVRAGSAGLQSCRVSGAHARTTLLPEYQLPKTGILSFLPTSWIPFAELMRMDKPAGTLYLFLPCLFSTLLAACYSATPVSTVLITSLLFYAGAFIMRGAGCTINDLWDRDFDPKVLRTRLRPIARGAITPTAALTFAGVQSLAGLAVLLQFPAPCLFYGIPSLLLVTTYPLAKRVTHYPQVVLGMTFSWGAIMGFPALGVDLIAHWEASAAVICLYLSCVSWTVFYDMIYAHMDIKDDAKVGIKSIALKHEKQTKAVLSGMAVLQTGFLAAAGHLLGLGPVYFFVSCGSAAVTLGSIVRKVNLKDAKDCWWWFTHGCWLTGGGIASGIMAEYALG